VHVHVLYCAVPGISILPSLPAEEIGISWEVGFLKTKKFKRN